MAGDGIGQAMTLVADYGPGHDAEASFAKVFAAAGGTVAGSLRVPLRDPDFAAFLQRVADAKPEALFVFLPMLTGVLTGLMAGFVGAAFPLLLSLLGQMQLQDERLSWIMLALVAGNLGQMTSPVHTCFVVTSEFFRVPFAAMWRSVAAPATIQFGLAVAYVAVLHAFGAKL